MKYGIKLGHGKRAQALFCRKWALGTRDNESTMVEWRKVKRPISLKGIWARFAYITFVVMGVWEKSIAVLRRKP